MRRRILLGIYVLGLLALACNAKASDLTARDGAELKTAPSGNARRVDSGMAGSSCTRPCSSAEDNTAGVTAEIPGNSVEVKQLAPGVYAAVRHVEAGTLDGNTMFIINDSDVVVVDTGVYPTSALQMIAKIRTLTDKPVRYVINTHWHGDHVMGNQAYREAFPGVEIISHPVNRDEITGNLSLEKLVPNYRAEIDNIQKKLDTGKDSDGKPLTAARRQHMELAKSGFEFWIADARAIAMPTMTVADSLVLHRGARDIEVKFLGRGHTSGDLVVYLPKERIVATGDLVVHPIPFGGSSYLQEWAGTLRKLKLLGATTIVPGHGEILSDWSYVDRQIGLFESTWKQVKTAVDAGADLEATHKAVNGDALSKAFGTVSPEARDDFAYTYLDPAIEATFKELRPGGAAAPVMAETAAKEKPCADPAYSKLDFWVGEWTVSLPDGKFDGSNRIEKVVSGCAIIENWVDREGHEGKSFFYYRPVLKQWKQVWVPDQGAVKEKVLLDDYAGPGIRFQGEIPRRDGGTYLDRTTLIAEPDGKVRQIIEVSFDRGATWDPQNKWEGIYSRVSGKKEKAKPAKEKRR